MERRCERIKIRRKNRNQDREKRMEGEKVETGETEKTERITEKLKNGNENTKRKEDKRNEGTNEKIKLNE